MLKVVSMDRMLVESIEEQSCMTSSICSSVQNTTLGDGVHWRLRTLTSSFASCSKLEKSSSYFYWLFSGMHFFTYLLSLGNSMASSQSITPPTFIEVLSKILKGPLHQVASSTSMAFVDGAVGMNFLPDRGCL